ncbi:CHRD domain-containing protein [Halorussus halophilus]|uniref:CHRD domain-containing protein n=1 Tax=Halorussus halophilus TaxID=2650975 RepID=UPI001300CE49|nr:CHRD domain-containing protein [Halorussus halophilus]
MTTVSRRRVLASLASVAVGGTASGRTAETAAGESTQSTDAEQFELYSAFLTGSNQVPPVETTALGTALFRVDFDQQRADYWLFVANVENARESHIHKGPPDLNGNVVAYLFGPVEEPVSTTGLLSSGTLRGDDLVWPLTDVASLREQMATENVYVNVHTTDHPSGEIRGQIRPLEGVEAGTGVESDDRNRFTA